MAKLPRLSGLEVIKILEKSGFTLVGRKGSHIRLQKIMPEKVYVTVVPYAKEIPTGTLKSIIRQSGLSEDDFRKY